MLLRFDPLVKSRDFRLLFVGQTVSFIGSMVTYTVIPYQVYEITQSSLQVGLISVVQLVATLVFGILGGSLADRMDRRSLLIWAELLMAVVVGLLAWNSQRAHPDLNLLFALTFILQAANAYHRPAAEAMTQLMVSREDFGSVAALGSLRYSVGAILGPAFGGVIIATGGSTAAYLFDSATFIFATVAALMISRSFAIKPEAGRSFLSDTRMGLHFAVRNQIVMGSYLVDIIAMALAFPVALFPEMSQSWGGASALGWLYAAMAIGSLVVSIFAGWATRSRDSGRVLIISAGMWAGFVVALGFAPSLFWAVACLALAGVADTFSGLSRRVIWNEAIPNEYRGRMAGLEMISYMAGPLVGNFRVGAMAKSLGASVSIYSGALLGIVLIAAGTVFVFPKLWAYRTHNLAK